MARRISSFLLIAGSLVLSCPAGSQSPIPTTQARKLMSQIAEGNFDVKNAPLPADEATTGTAIGRFALDKQYHGDLDAIARGEMLGAGNPASGTAGYVAMEQVTGTLKGRKGTFALQHNGSMEAGKFELNVTIVPGSGSGELAGIAGSAVTNAVS
jgi:hypothetical protein